MSKWLKAIGIICLWVTSAWMIIGDWVHYLRHEGVIHEHTALSFDAGPTQESVRITGLWGRPAVRSIGARFHLVA
jgi:hypothetical protein